MNRKASEYNMKKIVEIIALLVVLFVVVLIILNFNPITENIFKGAGNVLKDFFKDYLGIDIAIGEEDNAELVRLDYLKPDVRPVISGIYDAIKAAQASDQEKCVVEYPKTDGLGKDALAFEKDTEEGGMRIRYVNEHGDRKKIKEIKPLTGLEPCFVAGKTKKEGIIVAQNLYENWFQASTEKKMPEYNTGNIMILYKYPTICIDCTPYKLQISGKSDISSGTEYYNYNHFFIYKADEEHICFMPESKKTVWRDPTSVIRTLTCEEVKAKEDGLYSECFNEIKEKIPDCRSGTSDDEKKRRREAAMEILNNVLSIEANYDERSMKTNELIIEFYETSDDSKKSEIKNIIMETIRDYLNSLEKDKCRFISAMSRASSEDLSNPIEVTSCSCTPTSTEEEGDVSVSTEVTSTINVGYAEFGQADPSGC